MDQQCTEERMWIMTEQRMLGRKKQSGLRDAGGQGVDVMKVRCEKRFLHEVELAK